MKGSYLKIFIKEATGLKSETEDKNLKIFANITIGPRWITKSKGVTAPFDFNRKIKWLSTFFNFYKFLVKSRKKIQI